MADGQRPRPRHRAPSRAALRAPRRARHRLHDPLPVDEPRLLRGDRRRAVVGAVPGGEPSTRAHVRAVPRPLHRRRDGADEHARAGDRRSRVRGARARREDAAHRRRTSGARSATTTASTSSASTARTTTTRSGPSASSSAWRRSCTARCSSTGSRARSRATSTTTSTGSAASHESLCKALFLGGVTRRFPELRVGFLEGGVSWACELFAGLVGHWEKRNQRRDPARSIPTGSTSTRSWSTSSATATTTVTREPRRDPRVLRTSGGAARAARRVRRAARSSSPTTCATLFEPQLLLRLRGRRPARRVGVPRRHQPARRAPAPDPRLRHLALGRPRHDRAGRRGVRGWSRTASSSERDFRDFTFLNPVRLHAGANPDFFAGTRVEAAASARRGARVSARRAS